MCTNEVLRSGFCRGGSLASDCRANAKNIFGFRGTSYPLWPQQGMGVKYYYSSASAIGGLWPYWISAGGLAYRPFWDHVIIPFVGIKLIDVVMVGLHLAA